MARQSLTNKFIFNEKIDDEYIYGLYQDDYFYVAEIFQTALEHFDGDLQHLKQAYACGDLTGLKKAVHKIKPVFGFTGMLGTQQHMQDFEDFCQVVKNFELIKDRYNNLLAEIEHAKTIIEQELQRLTAFTSAQL